MASEMHHMIIPDSNGNMQEYEIVDQEARSVISTEHEALTMLEDAKTLNTETAMMCFPTSSAANYAYLNKNEIYLNGSRPSGFRRLFLTDSGIVDCHYNTPDTFPAETAYSARLVEGHIYKLSILRKGTPTYDETHGDMFRIGYYDNDTAIWQQTFAPSTPDFRSKTFTATSKPIVMSIYVRNTSAYVNLRYIYWFEDITDRESIRSNVESLTSTLSTLKYVTDPPSYFETHLTEAINTVNTLINDQKTGKSYGSDVEAFIFITDPHWAINAKNSPSLIKKIVDSTSIQTIICGGDIIYSHNATRAGAVSEIRDFTNQMLATGAREYYIVFGNHDDNTNSGATSDICFTKPEVFNLLYTPFAWQSNVHWIFDDVNTLTDPIKGDYYFDHPMTKTRFLCLDWNYQVATTPRATWVSGILDRDDGYRVVVIFHGFYAADNDAETGIVEEHVAWLPILEPYKSKIVGCFTGHAHKDRIVDYWNDGTTPIIITDTDAFFTNREDMTRGTITEQCFDVVVINYKTKMINLTRIGRGSSRSVGFTLAGTD